MAEKMSVKKMQRMKKVSSIYARDGEAGACRSVPGVPGVPECVGARCNRTLEPGSDQAVERGGLLFPPIPLQHRQSARLLLPAHSGHYPQLPLLSTELTFQRQGRTKKING